jgi:hypothetical protein
VLTTLSAAHVGRGTDESSKPSCEASLVSKVPSKPPANNFHLKLTLRNLADEPRRFALPYFGSEHLKSGTIRFYDRPASDPPFSSSRYQGQGGDAVIVGCFGSKSSAESFNAVLLPPRGEVVFDDYEVMTFGEVLEGLELWEASTILNQLARQTDFKQRLSSTDLSRSFEVGMAMDGWLRHHRPSFASLPIAIVEIHP